MTPDSDEGQPKTPDSRERAEDSSSSECDEYLMGLPELMSEWASPEDEEAWRDL